MYALIDLTECSPPLEKMNPRFPRYSPLVLDTEIIYSHKRCVQSSSDISSMEVSPSASSELDGQWLPAAVAVPFTGWLRAQCGSAASHSLTGPVVVNTSLVQRDPV